MHSIDSKTLVLVVVLYSISLGHYISTLTILKTLSSKSVNVKKVQTSSIH